MLEVTTKQAIFVDSSISDTIRTCIVLGNHREALKVKTEFKVETFVLSIMIMIHTRGLTNVYFLKMRQTIIDPTKTYAFLIFF